MKQLLSISKDRKGKADPNKPPFKLELPQDQEQNFIFNTNSDSGDEDSLPQQQILAYAQCIGIKLPKENDLLYIARQGLLAELPDEWHVQELGSGQIMYINSKTKEKSLEHPCDDFYRQKVINERKRKVKNIKGLTKIDIPKSKTSFISNVFNHKDDNDEDLSSPATMFQKTEAVHSNARLDDDIDAEPQMSRKQDRQRKKRSHKTPEVETQAILIQKKEPSLLVSKRKENFPPLALPKKTKNEELLARRKQQIQEEVTKKYQAKLQEQERLKSQQIKQIYAREEQLRNTPATQLEQLHPEMFGKHRKQLERQLMQEHVANLKKMREDLSQRNKADILKVYSSTDADHLFTEMAKMRKIMAVKNGEENLSSFLQQISDNSHLVHELESQKVVLELQAKLRQKASELLKQITPNNSAETLYQHTQSAREHFLQQMERMTSQSLSPINKKEGVEQEMTEMSRKMQANQRSQASLLEQLEGLKSRLQAIKQQNEGNKGQLSDRQSGGQSDRQKKLFELLQNRVALSARSHQKSA